MKKKTLVPAAALAFLALFSTASNAAMFPIEQSLTWDSPSSMKLEVPDLAAGASVYYELVVSAFGNGGRDSAPLITSGTSGDTGFVLFRDLDAARSSVNTGAVVGQGSTMGGALLNLVPFFAHLADPGQYVLEITAATASTPTPVSATPLPGALWVFASALGLFTSLSLRRRI